VFPSVSCFKVGALLPVPLPLHYSSITRLLVWCVYAVRWCGKRHRGVECGKIALTPREVEWVFSSLLKEGHRKKHFFDLDVSAISYFFFVLCFVLWHWIYRKKVQKSHIKCMGKESGCGKVKQTSVVVFFRLNQWTLTS